MIDLIGEVARALGRRNDSASATGSAHAKASEHLGRFGSTQAGRVNAAISSRLGGFNSIQRGTISLPLTNGGNRTQTATISSVTMARSRLIISFAHYSSASAISEPRFEFTNATTISATYYDATSGPTGEGYFSVYEHAA